jgi:hypothetical protein
MPGHPLPCCQNGFRFLPADSLAPFTANRRMFASLLRAKKPPPPTEDRQDLCPTRHPAPGSGFRRRGPNMLTQMRTSTVSRPDRRGSRSCGDGAGWSYPVAASFRSTVPAARGTPIAVCRGPETNNPRTTVGTRILRPCDLRARSPFAARGETLCITGKPGRQGLSSPQPPPSASRPCTTPCGPKGEDPEVPPQGGRCSRTWPQGEGRAAGWGSWRRTLGCQPSGASFTRWALTVVRSNASGSQRLGSHSLISRERGPLRARSALSMLA